MKRRRKLEDVQKRKEFLREHGVEPGFLTGSWMDKFGTLEGDEAKVAAEAEAERQREDQRTRELDFGTSPLATTAVVGQRPVAAGDVTSEEMPQKQEKKKVKMWLGIW